MDAPPLTRAQIIAERTRTLDQIKRLYAVVMGFAVTNCVARSYSSLQPLSLQSIDANSILVSQGITFVSLIVLFYLGAERMLDIKYLQPASPVPRPGELVWDLFQMGATSVMFIVLAHSIPENATRLDQVVACQRDFTLNLIILYGLDSLILLAHLPGLVWGQARIAAVGQNALRAHAVWLAINLACVPILILARLHWSNSWIRAPGFSLNGLAMAMLVLHIARFFADFLSTYRFYYPTTTLGSASDA